MLVVGFGILSSVSGCMNAQNHGALEAIQSMKQEEEKPEALSFVELFIEYPGPQEKWAGPANFVLHVKAKENGPAMVMATPSWFNSPIAKHEPKEPPQGIMAARLATANTAPANGAAKGAAKGAKGANDGSSVNRGPASEYVRDQMNRLAAAMKEDTPSFRGCLSPVRIRLVRSNGALVEKAGCRSEKGWPHVASELVEQFMSASLN